MVAPGWQGWVRWLANADECSALLPATRFCWPESFRVSLSYKLLWLLCPIASRRPCTDRVSLSNSWLARLGIQIDWACPICPADLKIAHSRPQVLHPAAANTPMGPHQAEHYAPNPPIPCPSSLR